MMNVIISVQQTWAAKNGNLKATQFKGLGMSPQTDTHARTHRRGLTLQLVHTTHASQECLHYKRASLLGSAALCKKVVKKNA